MANTYEGESSLSNATLIEEHASVRVQSMSSADEFEMKPRVERIEQQLQQLPLEWRQFAGKPLQMSYYHKKVNTFRENRELRRPSDSFAAWGVGELRKELGEEGRRLTDKDLDAIVCQEWRTDLARSTLETRLNRHGSRDGPVVRRSPSGVIYVAPQPTSPSKFVLDAIATPPPRKKPTAPK